MPVNHIVGKIPDKIIIEVVEKLEAEFGQQHKAYRYGEIEVTNDAAQVLKAAAGPTYYISEASYSAIEGIFTFTINRGINGVPSPYYDQIIVRPSTNGRTITAPQAVRIEEIIRSCVVFPQIDAPAESTDAIGIMERQLAALGELHNKMLSETTEARGKLEVEYTNSRQVLEEAKGRANSDIEEKEKASLARIATRQAELEEKLKEFDISDHMRARRQLRENITTQVEGFLLRPVVTGFKSSKFLLVVIICLAAAAGAGLFAFESFQAFINASNITATGNGGTYLMWILALRGIVLTGVSIGFIAYLISMLRKSFDEDVRNQRELQHYGMDINRASWVIETAMEMTTKEGATLPDKWVEGSVYGLFQYGSKADSETSSLAALGAIMGLGPEVSVGPGGASFKIPPKGAKKAAQDGD